MTPPPDASELAAWGMTIEDMGTDEVGIWPDNLDAFELFASMRTQWRMGPSGPVGLDYMVMYHKAERMGLHGDELTAIEADVALMEDEALKVMHEK